MWPDGWTALDRVGTLPTRLYASARRHSMTDRTEGLQSIFQGSPLSGCKASLGPQMILDASGLNGEHSLVAVSGTMVLSTLPIWRPTSSLPYWAH